MTTDRVAAIYVPIRSLNEWKDNPRDNKEAIPEVMKSIEKFGFSAPIIARKADNMIIEGHTRYAAAKAMGLKEVPVRFMDLDPTNSKLLALASNRLSEIADWSKGLGDIVNELEQMNVDFDGVGFSTQDLDELLSPFKEVDFLSDALDDYKNKTYVDNYGDAPNLSSNATSHTPEVEKYNAPWDNTGEVRLSSPSETIIEFVCPMSVDERTMVSSVIRKSKRLNNIQHTRHALLEIIKFYDVNNEED